MLLGPKVPLDVAPAGPMYESIIMCSTVRGARLTLWTVQVIDPEDFLAVAPCADLTIHSVARRKGRSCAVGSRCQSAVTSRVAQPLERASIEAASLLRRRWPPRRRPTPARRAASASARGRSACCPLPCSCALVSDAGVGSPIVSVWLSAPALRGLGGCCPRHCWARRFAHGDMRSIARS